MAIWIPQITIAILGNLAPLCFGLHIGWFAPLDIHIRTQDSPLERPLTENEASWLAAVPIIAILAGAPVFGWLLQSIPRRSALILATIPHSVIFISFSLTQNITATMCLRFLAGLFSAGAIIISPVFISECADDRWRGTLCGSSALFINTGVAVSYVLGLYLPYVLRNYVSSIFPALLLLSLFWLPESPVRLLSVGDEKGAVRSLKVLQGTDDVDEALCKISAGLVTAELTGKSSLQAVLKDPVTRSALAIIIGIMSMQQLCGITPTNAYMVEIVRAISSMDSKQVKQAAVVISLLQLLTSAAVPILLSFTGRKANLLASGWMMSVSLTVVAVSAFFSDMTFLPTVSLAVFVCAYNIGLGSVPFVLLPELLPPASRGVAAAIAGTWVSLLCFAVTKSFPFAVSLVTIHGCFALCAAACLLGTVFIHFCVFETRAMSAQDIFVRLRGKRLPVEEFA